MKTKNNGLLYLCLTAIICLSFLFFTYSAIDYLTNDSTNVNQQTISPTTTQKNEKDKVEKKYVFSPTFTENTDPKNLGIKTFIEVNGKVLENASSFKRDEKIYFEDNIYSSITGVPTFRGNNFRQGSSFGKSKITNQKFDDALKWFSETGTLKNMIGSGYWSGNGWTGQPLIIKWPEKTKKIMNMYDSAKNDKDLVEVIYPSMDGMIYFINLNSGQYTRDPVDIGFTFKGAGALDPRGYPILYVGSGDNSPNGNKCSRIFIISLIDGKILDEIGYNDGFAPRSWYGFDGSSVVNGKTDTLIYPGENGVIYSVKLGTNYDEENGSLSIGLKDMVKFKYTTKRSNSSTYWLGVETSLVALGEYIIIGDNAGDLLCINANTFKVVWAQDVLDDTNCSPVLEFDKDGKPYIYISTSLHWTAVNERGAVPVWKINAENGEIVWETNYDCRTVSELSGGVLGTIALGKNDLSDLIFVPIARTPSINEGLLVALDKKTGKEVWNFKTSMYSWSSPVDVYSTDNKGYVIHCDTAGVMYLLDGLTGEVLNQIKLNGIIEASPAVYNGKVVIGTRAQKIYGIDIV